MSIDHSTIAEVIRKELIHDTKRLNDLQSELAIVSGRVEANSRWLETHGFPMNQDQKSIQDEGKIATQGLDADSTIREHAIAILHKKGPMSITELHKALEEAGKTATRVGVDRTIRMHTDIFVMTKRDGRVSVSLK